MPEYIEREKVLSKAAPVEGCFSNMISAYDILMLPAAYVAPVRHGRWLCVDTDTEQFFLCNRCKKKEYWESNYCPSCGTKMDGGAE